MESTIRSDLTPCSLLEVNQRLEEYVASIFRIEEVAKQETSVKTGG
jgi:hypothetical protein